MRNITVSVPKEVYTAARMYATRYETSISSMVADLLSALPNRCQTPFQFRELGETGSTELHSPEMKIA
jgi:hypothetical protein